MKKTYLLALFCCFSLFLSCCAEPDGHESYLKDSLHKSVQAAYPNDLVKEVNITFNSDNGYTIASFDVKFIFGKKLILDCDQASSQRLYQFVNDVPVKFGNITTTPMCPDLRLGDDLILHLSSPSLKDKRSQEELSSLIREGMVRKTSSEHTASVMHMLYAQFENYTLNQSYINPTKNELWLDTNKGIYHFVLTEPLQWEKDFYRLKTTNSGDEIAILR